MSDALTVIDHNNVVLMPSRMGATFQAYRELQVEIDAAMPSRVGRYVRFSRTEAERVVRQVTKRTT